MLYAKSYDADVGGPRLVGLQRGPCKLTAVASIHQIAEKASLLGNPASFSRDTGIPRRSSAARNRASERKEGDIVLLLPSLPSSCEGVEFL